MSLIQTFPIAFAFALTALAVQAVLLLLLLPGRLIGDEKDYVGAHVATQDLWVRVPLHRIVMRAVDRLAPGPAYLGPRLLNSLISVLSVGVAAAYVETTAGVMAACVTGLFLLISLERAILALHLWPDIAIGLIIAAVALLWAHPSPSNAVWAAGLATVGFALRVECAVLVVLTAMLPLAVSEVAGLHQVAPGLVALCGVFLLSLHARIHRGTWWPDTTLFFNLAVARTELTLHDPTTADVMRETSRHVARRTVPPPPPMSAFGRVLAMLLGRVRVILGPDVYVAQNLVSQNAARYRKADWLCPPRWGAVLLRYGFTAQAVVFAVAVPWMPADLLGLFLVMFGVYAGLQTRGRYRMGLLPLMAVMLGLSVQEVAVRGVSGSDAVWAGLLLAACLLVLWRVPRRDERSTPDAAGSEKPV